MSVSVIILAAGSSTRMGQSKQLLKWGDTTLLSHAAKTAINSSAGDVFVVLGDHETVHRKAIENLAITIVNNPLWKKGMGSSLKAGLKKAVENPKTDAILVMVCDQPFVTSKHLDNIIELSEKSRQSIIASTYGKTVGVPALFGREHFNELSEIGDVEGARKLIGKYKKSLGTVYLKDGEKDIDTYEEYLNSY